ncbi:histidinol-phosphate aminotransferase [Micromonospora pisi]|uniref:Histidinol-phosphate aminotransferase n=1 Tax=Micromonospora pisi TaxID=589240 RepID=A0A495JTQ1_9ACTN|nr:histidinol-phosphate transaminase [Micromonospora pisi]RKR92376.1 histidinol-phosphate aminotransferase [Micromonospora pisi]
MTSTVEPNRVADGSTRTAPVAELAMNETPYPPLPSVLRLVREGAERLNRYPDHNSGALVAALAARLGVPAAQVLVGPGSAGLSQHIVASLGPDRPEVVYPALSFEGYPLIVANAGARPVPVPLDGYRHDLRAMADAVTEQTRCVLICNPNNPTGAVLGRAEIEEFLDRIPPEVVVIVDEAYREFVTDPDVPDALDLYRDRDNVCVLRTFSKAYGLATLRVGYAVAPPRVAAAARMVGLVFYPGGLGQTAALACLDEEAGVELAARRDELVVARTRLRDGLLAAGLPVAPSEANFLWLPLGPAALEFADRCRRAGILVRPYPEQGVRITVGTAEANERVLTVARDTGRQVSGE